MAAAPPPPPPPPPPPQPVQAFGQASNSGHGGQVSLGGRGGQEGGAGSVPDCRPPAPAGGSSRWPRCHS